MVGLLQTIMEYRVQLPGRLQVKLVALEGYYLISKEWANPPR